MFPVQVVLLILNPIWVTLLALIALIWLLSWTGIWARYKYRILLALLAAYAVDAGFALPRILFAHSLSKGPAIAQQIPLPRRLVLVDVPCGAKCHDWLITGAVEEIVSVSTRQPRYASVTTAVRYQAGWTLPSDCPREREMANRDPSVVQRRSGYCPLVEPVEIPKQGVFLVHEGMTVTAKESARAYTPTNLVKAPPGPVIRFSGIELQNRTAAGIAVLASAYRYEAPGLLGLPPLIGCWNRPDNVLWVMPPGDTGCGFWRWFTWGGDDRASYNPKWLFEQAFGLPDHPLVPPKRAELPPPTPAQALEILSKVWGIDIDFHLSHLRDAVLDPSNSDQALTDLVTKRGTLEGSLIALLAANRPATLAGFSRRLNPVPWQFANSGTVLEEMQRNPKFRDEFADTMFLMLASHWQQTPGNKDRFLKLMETGHPGWLCEKLGRVNASDTVAKDRESRIVKDYGQRCRS